MAGIVMNKLLLGAAVFAGAIGWALLAPRSTTFGLFAGDQIGRFLTIAVGYIATVAGAFLGGIYRELRARQRRGETRIESPLSFFGELLRSINVWLAITGSPIVFALLLKTASGMGLSGIVVVALENGFSCLLVLDSLVGEKNLAPRSKPAHQV
jgi:hypothetical protein